MTVAATGPDIGATLQVLQIELRSLAEQVQKVASDLKFAHLEAPGPCATWLTTLVSQRYRLVHPIPVIVEQSGTEVAISWPEAQLSVVGSSEIGAWQRFEEELVDLADELVDAEESSLGPLPARWRTFLLCSLERVQA